MAGVAAGERPGIRVRLCRKGVVKITPESPAWGSPAVTMVARDGYEAGGRLGTEDWRLNRLPGLISGRGDHCQSRRCRGPPMLLVLEPHLPAALSNGRETSSSRCSEESHGDGMATTTFRRLRNSRQPPQSPSLAFPPGINNPTKASFAALDVTSWLTIPAYQKREMALVLAPSWALPGAGIRESEELKMRTSASPIHPLYLAIAQVDNTEVISHAHLSSVAGGLGRLRLM